jgi:hypothetical protein
VTQGTLDADQALAPPGRTHRGPPISAAKARLKAAGQSLASDPLGTLAWVLSSALVTLLAPIWGAAFVMMGFMSARRRLRTEGLVGLGEVLVPEMARVQFERGLFSGIWRVQKLSVALALVQLPTTLLALAPAALLYAMFIPALGTFPGTVGMLLAFGVPGFVALIGLAFIAAEQMLTLRILALSGPDYSLGLVQRAVGAAWRTTIEQGSLLFGLSLGVGAASIAAGIFVGGSAKLASVLELGGGIMLVMTWTAAVAGVLLLAFVYETLVSWAESVPAQRIEDVAAFSFSKWVVSWMQSVAELPLAKGAVTIGLILVLAIGLLTTVFALATGAALSSWLGLGWFAVTATTLLFLSRKGATS